MPRPQKLFPPLGITEGEEILGLEGSSFVRSFFNPRSGEESARGGVYDSRRFKRAFCALPEVLRNESLDQHYWYTYRRVSVALRYAELPGNLFEIDTVDHLSIQKYFTRPAPIIPIEVNRAWLALIVAARTN